jgi:hypothetical protein
MPSTRAPARKYYDLGYSPDKAHGFYGFIDNITSNPAIAAHGHVEENADDQRIGNQ